MAAYYKVEVSLNTNSVTVGAPSAQEVLVTLPLVGPAGATGPQGPAGAGAVESVNAQTGVVVLNASDVAAIATSVLTTQGDIVVRGASAPQRLALGNGVGKPLVVGASGPEWSVADSNFVLSQSVKISNAGTTAVNGVYLPTNSINGKASYIKEDYTISWDGASWNISANTTDYYTSSNDTSYPWQATTWTVDSGASPYPDVEQAAFSDMESVLGSKSYNTRTPSSTLAHASSHHTGGTDAIAPNNIGAGWAQVLSGQFISGNTLLSAGRNRRITLSAINKSVNVDLPYESNESGDTATLIASSGLFSGSTLSIRTATNMSGGVPVTYFTLATLTAAGQSFTFVSDGTATGWTLQSVNTHAASHHTGGSDALAPANIGAAAAVHTHVASDITSGTLDNARVNFASPPAIGSTTPNSGSFTTLAANNGVPLTASAPVLNLAQTWNNAAVAFTALRVNATNTASAAASLLADFQVGGTSLLTINRAGGLGLGGSGWVNFGSSFGQAVRGVGVWGFSNAVAFNVSAALGGNSGAVQLGSTSSLGWSSAAEPTSANTDVRLFRDAADTLAQYRGTNPQTFRLYNTFTDASNYERGFMRWSSNVLQIGTEKGGTGSARALEFQTDGVSRWTIATNGTLSASSASRLNVNSLMFQHYGTGNALIGENCEFAGAWRYIAAGAAGMFYFSGPEGQFRFFASGSALAALPNSGNSTQFKVNADGTVALGGTGSYNAGVYTDNTLSVNSTTATFKDAANIAVGTTTGTKIGTATTQKLGFFNATPVVQQAAVADATDAATVITQLNALLARIRALGLIAT